MVKNRIFAVLLLIVVLCTMIPSVYAGTSVADLMTNSPANEFEYENGFKIMGITDKSSVGDQDSFWSGFLDKYKSQIVGIAGAISLTFLIFFIINFSKLGQSSGNPQMRQQAIMGIIWCGLGCMCTGGIGIFFGFFWTAFTK